MPKKIRGRIIRIVDPSTILINLGREHGIEDSTQFSILADPEEIIDPATKEVLGNIFIVKGRLRASQVFPRYTIASSKWVQSSSRIYSNLFGEEMGEDLNIRREDIQPWKAKTEQPVKVGDEVEASIPDEAPKAG